MAGERTPGHMCQVENPLQIEDGTTCRAVSHPPGSLRAHAYRGLSPRARAVLLHRRLDNLRKLRADTVALFDDIDKELDKNVRRLEGTSEVVNGVATVANIGVGLSKLVQEGFAAIKLSGTALEHANHHLAKEALKFASDPLEDVALHQTGEFMNSKARKPSAQNKDGELKTRLAGLAWALGAATLNSFLKMQEPSFWAGVVVRLKSGKSWSQSVTGSPEEDIAETRRKLKAQREQALKQLDERFQQAERALASPSGSAERPAVNGVSAPLTIPNRRLL